METRERRDDQLEPTETARHGDFRLSKCRLIDEHGETPTLAERTDSPHNIPRESLRDLRRGQYRSLGPDRLRQCFCGDSLRDGNDGHNTLTVRLGHQGLEHPLGHHPDSGRHGFTVSLTDTLRHAITYGAILDAEGIERSCGARRRHNPHAMDSLSGPDPSPRRAAWVAAPTTTTRSTATFTPFLVGGVRRGLR